MSRFTLKNSELSKRKMGKLGFSGDFPSRTDSLHQSLA